MNTQNTSQPQTSNPTNSSGKSRRGFASMDKERHKLVSSKGGKTERRNNDLTNKDGRLNPST